MNGQILHKQKRAVRDLLDAVEDMPSHAQGCHAGPYHEGRHSG